MTTWFTLQRQQYGAKKGDCQAASVKLTDWLTALGQVAIQQELEQEIDSGCCTA